MIDADALADRIRVAVDAVEGARVPEDLREAAFARALDVVLPTALHPTSASAANSALGGPTGVNPGGEDSVAPYAAPSPGGALAKIAQKLGIDAVSAEAVYYIDGDALNVILSPSKFAKKVTAAMEEIARLVVAGRQAAGLDDWTSVKEIRAVCQDRGKFSGGNFSAYVARLDGDGFMARGSGQSRLFKANATGFENTGALVKRLLNQE